MTGVLMADRATFADQALRHMRSLRAAAARKTGNRADAEDLVQETYLRAYRGFGGYEEGTNLRAWLHRILTNTHINSFRARQRRPVEVALDPLEATSGRSAEDELIDRFPDDEVARAIELVPQPFRQTVLLADVAGFTYKEIAELIDVPIGTVTSRLHRGRMMLRQRLQIWVGSSPAAAENAVQHRLRAASR